MGLREEAIGEAFNLGSAKEYKVIDMAGIVNKLTGNDTPVIFTERGNWDVKCRLLSSVEKANRILGYKPQIKFKEGLEKVYLWFSINWNDIKQSAEF